MGEGRRGEGMGGREGKREGGREREKEGGRRGMEGENSII